MSIRTSKDVFICHASEDKESIVNPIKVACREIGISTWVDDDEIQWGDSITKRVQAGLVNSKLVLLVMSESSIAKNWPDTELSAAIHLEMASTGVRVLPLLCGDPEKLLARYPFVAQKSCKMWNGDAKQTANEINNLLNGRNINMSPAKTESGAHKNRSFAIIGAAIIAIFGIGFLLSNRPSAESKVESKPTHQSSTGDTSPIVNAGGDVTIQIGKEAAAKPELIASQDGAGAMLMKEPDFREFLSLSIGGTSEIAIGRLMDGTPLADLHEQTEQSPDSPPWIKVRVLDGRLKDQQGWVMQSSVRKP